MTDSPLHPTLGLVVRALARMGARVRIEGLANIPSEGPFLLLSNHQSAVDPVFIQAWAGREIHAMTKSSQFRHPAFRWLLPRLHAFPTRRYRIDPQAVRVALRRLEEGKGVSIYAEGERTWDGRVQRFRQGTVRLALRAGVPIVPCGISGAYDVWPRWAPRPRRAEVIVRYGAPIRWDAHRDREERERALPEAARTLEASVRALVDEPPPAGSTGLGQLLDRQGAPAGEPSRPSGSTTVGLPRDRR